MMVTILLVLSESSYSGRAKVSSPPVMLVIKLSQVPKEVHLRRPVKNCYRGALNDSVLWSNWAINLS